MCTVTWLREPGGYTLFFNRDERRTRRPALPPRVHAADANSFIAPTDGDFGGSWITVNRFGLSLGLLNYYEKTEPTRRDAAASRGALVISLAGAASDGDVRDRMAVARLEDFNPFVLLVMQPDRDPIRFTWDGGILADQEATEEDLPVTTSGFEPLEVAAARRETFLEQVQRAGGVDLGTLEEYHRSRVHTDPAYDVCMSRPESATVSFSRVRVTRDRASLRYQEVDADARSFGAPVEIAIPIENG